MRISYRSGSALLLAMAISAVSGCGGAAADADNSVLVTSTSPEQPTGEISGVATPSSVAVVTATNAN